MSLVKFKENIFHQGQWIISPKMDSLFILGPGLLSVLVVILLNLFNILPSEVNMLSWLILVVFIDVGHVWSTLYRTYIHERNFKEYRELLILTPALCFVLGTVIHSLSAIHFWKTLAYLAVFHFVRQQYGFFMLYRNKESSLPLDQNKLSEILDKVAIYTVTLVPIIHWHVKYPKEFFWFIENDFFRLPYPFLEKMAWAFYILIVLGYLLKEIKLQRILSPKNIFFLGTVLSWYVGIVHFNGDWAFTVTNVVAHGIPYTALIWFSNCEKPSFTPTESVQKFLWQPKMINRFLLFAALLMLIGYIEEGLWDSLVWKDHSEIFPGLNNFKQVKDDLTLSWLVPLLSLPQVTHYVLDGFIWKSKRPMN